jgi:1-acyl-sn-glycerol-3-phosphate acyltransferase
MVLLKIFRLTILFLTVLIGVLFIAFSTLVSAFSHKPTLTLWLAQKWYRLLLLVMNIRVETEGHYDHQGALVCSNHITWLDIPVIGSILPTYFLSKAEVRQVPVIGWLAHHAGTLFIHRGGGQLNEVKGLMREYLSSDHCLTFFPEATTGNGFAIRQFHPRLFAAAIETGTPLLPVSVHYTTKTQTKLNVDFGDESMGENVWRILGRWQTTVKVTLLPVIQTEELERKVLADTAMNIIAESLHLPPERRGLSFREPLPAMPPEQR